MEAVKEKTQEGKPKMQAMMEAYEKLAIPGAPHKLLEKMAGSWTSKGRMWKEPGATPVESSGVSEQKMILGGRFLHQEENGDMAGHQYSGVNITGYDNHTQKFITANMSSMATGIYLFEGPASADGKTIRQENRYDEPVLGPMQYRTVTRIVDDNTYTFEMYAVDKNGTEQKMMETTYTRKK